MTLDHTPGRLQAQFAGRPVGDHTGLWDALWTDKFTPWDRGGPSLALRDLLSERPDLVVPPSVTASEATLTSTAAAAPRGDKRKTALVPGCGRGYDVLLLAAFGYRVVGLDASAAALAEARDLQLRLRRGQVEDAEGVYQPRPGAAGQLLDDGEKSVQWVVGDFFNDEFLKGLGTEKFDLIYDYTFLCALPPSMRPAWAKRMSTLLAPEGRLICLEFPSSKPPSMGGPPWPVPENVYIAHLARPGEAIAYNGEQRVVGSQIGPPMTGSLDRLARIKPKRTHTSGMDGEGNVEDWISVWCHHNAGSGPVPPPVDDAAQ